MFSINIFETKKKFYLLPPSPPSPRLKETLEAHINTCSEQCSTVELRHRNAMYMVISA